MAYKFTQPCSIQKRKDLFALLRKLEAMGYKKRSMSTSRNGRKR